MGCLLPHTVGGDEVAIEEGKYPGELASPQQIHQLVEEYRKAAHQLLKLGRPGKPLTRAPFRLSAIHAIELYLTALLLHRGHNPNQIRKMHHDLSTLRNTPRRQGSAFQHHLFDLSH